MFMIAIVYMWFHVNFYIRVCCIWDLSLGILHCLMSINERFKVYLYGNSQSVDDWKKKNYDFLLFHGNTMKCQHDCPVSTIYHITADQRLKILYFVMHFQFQCLLLMLGISFKFFFFFFYSFGLNECGDNVRHYLICLLIPLSTWWLNTMIRRPYQIFLTFGLILFFISILFS